MIVKHVAWFRFKDGVSPERIEQHRAACRALVERIPALMDLEWGANFTDRAAGLTHCIIVTLPDRAALDTYLNHPAHVPVGGALKTDLAELRVMDIEL